MVFSKAAIARIALGAILLLILPAMGATGLSAWKETSVDFPSGENVNTHIEANGLTLEASAGSAEWTKVGTDSFPVGRYMPSMVFDSANNIHILFGGEMGGPGDDNRTWTYDGLRDRWTARSSANAPPGRRALAMAYDSRDGVTVLFGGGGDGQLNDTWTYNLTQDAWTEKRPAISPPTRSMHSMAYDPKSGLVVLFGGQHGLSEFPYHIELNDTWVYDLANNTWTNRTPVTGPSPRHGQSMCYDPSIGLIVLFGGTIDDGRDCYQDTWTYDAASNTWNQCHPSTNPSPRAGAPMAADLSSGTLFLFAGVIYGTIYNDGYIYNASSDTWAKKPFSAGPPVRSYSAMDYDTPTGTFLLYGGLNGGDRDDYWSYDPARNLWTKLDGLATPEPREGASVAYDAENRVGILFGGTSTYPHWHDDTWTYDAPANRWDKKRPALSPPPREMAGMCYDSDDGVVVMFGGFTYSSDTLADTWTYDVSSNTWTNRQPAQSPPQSWDCFMAYDPVSHLVILFCGSRYYEPSNETWTYDVKNNVWTNRTKEVAPPARADTAMAYDEGSRAMILFGGTYQDRHSRDTFYDDTWSFDASTFNWSQKAPASFPQAMSNHAMASDPVHGRVLLFGGAGSDWPHSFRETWAYNGTTDQWTNLTPSGSPEPRIWSGLYYDSNADVAVLFGGRGANGPMGDTWLLSPGGGTVSGSYTSAPKDTGGSSCFGTLQWEATMPAGTSMKFQLRTGASQPDMSARDFAGPDGTAASYFTGSGQVMPSMHNGSRWVQYRAYLTTGDIAKRPVLTSVTVNYNRVQSVVITSPASGASWTGVQKIGWTASDLDGDALAFDIYLLGPAGMTRLAGGLPDKTREWSWDTSGVEDGTYKLLISASDDNQFIPITVNATSGYFSIHPVPPLINHRPHVTLISPLNNSILATHSVRLEWKCTDIDGDTLTFTVTCGEAPPSMGRPIERTTTAEYLELDLPGNRTYYWTVGASDGNSNGTDIPTEVWRFTITLPSANTPIRITSTPTDTAWAGQEYAYNITTFDEDGDVPAFGLISGPPGMTLDPSTGQARWTPNTADIGNHTVVVQAIDGRGFWDTQIFTIRVMETVALPPRCAITSPANGSKASGTVRITGTAERGRLPLSAVFVRLDGGKWMVAAGLENWTLAVDLNKSTSGKHRIEARSFDGALYSETVSVDVMVRSPPSDVTVEPLPFCIPLMILGAVIGLGYYLLVRRRSKDP